MVIVITILGLGVLAASIIGPILPLYLTSIGVTPAVLGLIFSTVMAGMAIGESAWGWIADKVGMKLPLSVGTFAAALATLSIISTPNVLALFVILFFVGLVRSALFGPGRGYIGANAPLLKKATFMGIFAFMMASSRSIGAVPSGFIADNWGYHSVFYISGGISLIAGLLMVTNLKKLSKRTTTLPAAITAPDKILPSSQKKFNIRSLSAQCIVTALRTLGLGISIAFLPLLATEVIGVRASEVGILLSIGGIASMVFSIPMGILADKFGKKFFMGLGLVISTLSMVGVAYSQTFLWLTAFVATNRIGMSTFSPAALGMLSDSVPLEKQSTAMGIYGGICENSGIIAGSALGGFIWSVWGPQATFLMGAIAAGIGTLICFIFVKEKHK